MEWRVIPLQINNAFMNMAIDEAVSESVAKEAPPTIRFYRWLPSAVSIGYFQGIRDEVDIEKCNELGVHIVRRRTGGGAVYHDYGGEITYSVIAPERLFPKGIRESYGVICAWIVNGLRHIGIESEFKPINDIITNNKKISGNAQTRRNGIILQHGTILYDVDVRKMFSLLKVGQEKISDKMIAAVEERVTSVNRERDIGIHELHEALVQGFTEDKEYFFEQLTSDETNRAEELAEKRYSSEEWNYMR